MTVLDLRRKRREKNLLEQFGADRWAGPAVHATPRP
jgi:hypothetical protein